jgi:hypothetical protein
VAVYGKYTRALTFKNLNQDDQTHTPAEARDVRWRERAREGGTGVEAGASGVQWEPAVSARFVQGHTHGVSEERNGQSLGVAEAEGESEGKEKAKGKGKLFSELSEDQLRPLDDGVRGLVSEEQGEATISANPAMVSTASTQPSFGRNNKFSKVLYIVTSIGNILEY